LLTSNRFNEKAFPVIPSIIDYYSFILLGLFWPQENQLPGSISITSGNDGILQA
jgi:hypothetical protein